MPAGYNSYTNPSYGRQGAAWGSPQRGYGGYQGRQGVPANRTPQMNRPGYTQAAPQMMGRVNQTQPMMNQAQRMPQMNRMNQMPPMPMNRMNTSQQAVPGSGQGAQPPISTLEAMRQYDPSIQFESFNPGITAGAGEIQAQTPAAAPIEPPGPVTEENGEPRAFSGALTATALDSLARHIQDERNGTVFYGYLAGIARDDKKRSLLAEIIEGTKKNRNAFNEIYKSFSGAVYEIHETQVEASASFAAGVRQAVTEESMALHELADLYEKLEGAQNLKTLNAVIIRKIGDIGVLTGML